MRIIDKKDYIIITDLTIEKKLATYKVICDTKFVFVEFNFSALHRDPDNILGEVISVYKKKGEIKARIKLYKNQLKFREAYREILLKLIPVIGCQIFEIKNSLNIRTVSLGYSNQDETILSIGDQYIESIKAMLNKKLIKNCEDFKSFSAEEITKRNKEIYNQHLKNQFDRNAIDRITFESKISL